MQIAGLCRSHSGLFSEGGTLARQGVGLAHVVMQLGQGYYPSIFYSIEDEGARCTPVGALPEQAAAVRSNSSLSIR